MNNNSGKSQVKIIVESHNSNKSDWLYNFFIEKSRREDDKTKVNLKEKLYLVVPEQDTNEKQRIMMGKASEYGYGILNIDVVSFDRIAHNVFDILNIEPRKEKIIDDDAKTMMIMLILSKHKDELNYYRKMVKKVGFAKKLTQVMSEFYAYDVTEEDINAVIKKCDKEPNRYPNIKNKLLDFWTIYKEFKGKFQKDEDTVSDDKYTIREDKYDKLDKVISKVDIFKDAIVAFEGFTGFTPVQLSIFKKIVDVAKEVYLLIDFRDKDGSNYDFNKKLSEVDPFYLSKKFVVDIAKKLAVSDCKTLIYHNDNIKVDTERPEDLQHIAKYIYDYSYKGGENAPKVNNISIFECKNTEEEVIQVAHTVEKLIREGYKYNDIRIVAPKVEDYSDKLIRIFNRYNIPLFVDDAKTILNSPYIETIRAAIDVVNYDFSYDSVMRYINAGLFIKDRNICELDNFIREFGIRGKNRYEYSVDNDERHDYGFDIIIDQWKANQIKRAEEKNEEFIFEKSKYYRILETKKRIFDPLVDLSNKLKKENTITEYVIGIKDFIEAIELDKKFESFLKQLVYYANKENLKNEMSRELDVLVESKKVTDEAISNIESINRLMEDKISVEEFRQLFDVGFVDKGVKTIPHSLDQVVIGDFMRSRFYQPKVEICIGMNQSTIPASTNDITLIDDNMREVFKDIKELSQTTEETALNQRLYIYQAVTNPTEKLILTYPRLNASDESDEKSPVIISLIELFGKTKDGEKEVDRLEIKRIERENMDFYHESDLLEFVSSNMQSLRRAYVNQSDEEAKTNINNLAVKKAIRYLNDNQNGEQDFKEVFDNILHRDNYYKNEKLNSNFAEKMFDAVRDGAAGSATSIEQFNTCPYKYFLARTLGLEERKNYEVSSLDLGSFIHKVFEEFFKDVGNIKNVDTDNIDPDLDKAIKKAMGEIFSFNDLKNGDKQFFGSNKLDLIKRVCNNLIKKSIERMKKISENSSLNESFEEVEFTNEITKDITIEGRVDKVELASSDDGKVYVNVIDYKSGQNAKQLEIKDVIGGVSIQLILYLDYFKNYNKKNKKNKGDESDVEKLLKGKKVIPCGAFYFWVADPIIRIDSDKDPIKEINSVEQKRQEKLAYVGLANSEESVLKKIDSKIVYSGDGKSAKDPVTLFQLKKDFLSNDDTNSTASFKGLIDVVHEKIKSSIGDMKGGVIKAAPYNDDNCKYCPYVNICKKDTAIENDEESDSGDNLGKE